MKRETFTRTAENNYGCDDPNDPITRAQIESAYCPQHEALPDTHYCPSCEEQMPCAEDGICRGCDTVIDQAAADAFEEAQIAEAFASDNWRPRIVWNLMGTGSYGDLA